MHRRNQTAVAFNCWCCMAAKRALGLFDASMCYLLGNRVVAVPMLHGMIDLVTLTSRRSSHAARGGYFHAELLTCGDRCSRVASKLALSLLRKIDWYKTL